MSRFSCGLYKVSRLSFFFFSGGVVGSICHGTGDFHLSLPVRVDGLLRRGLAVSVHRAGSFLSRKAQKKKRMV